MLKAIKYIDWNNKETISVFGKTEELEKLIKDCNYHSEVAPLFDEMPKFSSKAERRYFVDFNGNQYSVGRFEEDDNSTMEEQINRFYKNEIVEYTEEYEFSSSVELLNFFFDGRVVDPDDIKEDPYWATCIDFPNEDEQKLGKKYWKSIGCL